MWVRPKMIGQDGWARPIGMSVHGGPRVSPASVAIPTTLSPCLASLFSASNWLNV